MGDLLCVQTMAFTTLMLVLYVPPLQRAFVTGALNTDDWRLYVSVTSSVLWLREASTSIARASTRAESAVTAAPARVSPAG